MDISFREWVNRKYEKNLGETITENKDGSVTVTNNNSSTRYASKIIYDTQRTPPSSEALEHIVLYCNMCNSRIKKESTYFYSCKKCSNYDLCNHCFPKLLVLGGKYYDAHEHDHTFCRVIF